MKQRAIAKPVEIVGAGSRGGNPAPEDYGVEERL
jgi:hypothetical protein